MQVSGAPPAPPADPAGIGDETRICLSLVAWVAIGLVDQGCLAGEKFISFIGNGEGFAGGLTKLVWTQGPFHQALHNTPVATLTEFPWQVY